MRLHHLSAKMDAFAAIGLFILTTITAVQTITVTSSNHFANRRCENPNKRTGTCVAIHDCQVLQQSEVRFIEASRCGGGFGTTPYVCCSSDTGFTRESRNRVAGVVRGEPVSNSNRGNRLQLIHRENVVPSTKWSGKSRTVSKTDKSLLLPAPPTCGGEIIDNRIYGGKDTEPNEFPWMAFLEYSKSDPTQEAVCAGSLINTRYILTAAHCVEGPIIAQKGNLVAARLALRDFTKDLIFPEDGQRWGIEEKIVHENYSFRKTPVHDIALLRLDGNVRYSTTVRPICLPSVFSPVNLKSDTKLTVAGWGSNEFRSSSPIKQKVNIALVNQKFCKQQYGKLGLTIEPVHICAGGAVNKDSCRGDSGAPLMHYRNGVWVLEGIVSFGRRCGYKDWPGVYTRVSSYSQWIKKKLRV